jgi:hypothetical protein
LKRIAYGLLRSVVSICSTLVLLMVSMSAASVGSPQGTSAVSPGGTSAHPTVQRVAASGFTATWRGGEANLSWSNPDNWGGGTVPGPFDLAVFDGASPDGMVDPAFAGTVAGVIMDAGYAGVLQLGRSLAVQGDLVIDGGAFAKNDYALTTVVLSESGGSFNGGAAPLWIEEAASVNGGILTTPYEVWARCFNSARVRASERSRAISKISARISTSQVDDWLPISL